MDREIAQKVFRYFNEQFILNFFNYNPIALKKMLEDSKNLTFAENTVTIKSALNEDSIAQIEALAAELCK